jgi:hypothetical protein
MLCISPAAGSATFGYIYLSDTERRHEAAITAYFDSAGRKVDVLPCPNFEQSVANNNLLYRDLLFLSDIPRYVIPAGLHIIEAQNYDDSPLFWATFTLPRYVPCALIPALSLTPVPPCPRRRTLPGSGRICLHLSRHPFNPHAPVRHVVMGGCPR